MILQAKFIDLKGTEKFLDYFSEIKILSVWNIMCELWEFWKYNI